MSPVLAILASLYLFDTATLPAGNVRRVSLLGYQLGAEVLDLEEAAARAEAPPPAPAPEAMGETPKPPPPRPGLVRLEPAPATGGVHLHGWGLTIVHDCDQPGAPAVAMFGPGQSRADAVPLPQPAEDVPRLEIAADDAPVPPAPGPVEVAVERVVTSGHFEAMSPPGARELVVVLDPDEEQLFADEPDPASVERPVGEIEPDLAIARPCDACHGGHRNRRGGCLRCDGRCVRVWCNNREIKPLARTRTEEEALGVVNALSDLFAGLDDRQRLGALDLFRVVTEDASPALRHQALAQWKLGARNAVVDARMAGASAEEEEAVAARWGAARGC